MKQIKKEERLKFFAIVLLGVPFFISLFGALAGVTPASSRTIIFNPASAYIALGLNIIFWLFGLAYRFFNKKTWWSWFFLYVFSVTCIPALVGVVSLNFVYASFPDWRLIASLGVMYVIAALLPFINERISEILHTEIFAPRSCLGRIIQISILSLAPIAGMVGALLSGVAERRGGVMGYSMMGLFFHFFFVWGSVSLAHQAWQRRPWKSTDKES